MDVYYKQKRHPVQELRKHHDGHHLALEDAKTHTRMHEIFTELSVSKARSSTCILLLSAD
jgi:hypothetical protein